MAPLHGAHLRHVGIRSADIPRTAAFYEDVFGLSRLRDVAGGSIVIGGGAIKVTIVPVVGNAMPVPEEGSEHIHLGFIVADVGASFRRWQQVGARILAGDVSSREALMPGEEPITSFKVADPNGNVIDVMGDPTHWLGVRI